MLRLLLITLSLIVSLARGSVVCDSVGSQCNVDSTHSFEYVYDLIIDYPTLGPTVVDDTRYDAVVQLNVLEGQSLSYSWELFNLDAGGQFDCSESRLWLNGTSVGATTYLRGATNDIPYCIFDVHDGVLSRNYLLNPTNMFLLLNSTVPVGDRLMIMKNFNEPVIAKQDIRFFLYDFVSLSAGITGGNGTNITIVARDIPYDNSDFEGVGDCNTMDTRMSTVQIGSCTFPSTGGGNGTYHYFLPKDQYDFCSTSKTSYQGDFIFGLPVSLTVSVGTCSYFRREDSVHQMSVFIPQSDIDESTNVTTTYAPSFAPSPSPTPYPSRSPLPDGQTHSPTPSPTVPKVCSVDECSSHIVAAQFIQLGALTLLSCICWLAFFRRKKKRCKYDDRLGISTAAKPGHYNF